MEKLKMLYASPFWPQKSGISNYSSALILELRKYFDITLLTSNYKVEDDRLSYLSTIRYSRGDIFEGFDVILYNFGNNPEYHGYMLDALRDNPGYVIMHDFSLYYLTVGVAQDRGNLFETIYKNAGVDGFLLIKESLRKMPERDLLLHKDLADKLPLNCEVLSLAKGIFVHSQYTKRLIENTGIKTNVYQINLIMTILPGEDKSNDMIRKEARELWEIPEHALLLVSAGFIAPTKQNVITCEAVETYNARHDEKVYYLMAGEGDYADNYLGKYCKKTGFISDELYAVALRRADMIINLRYPTNGETSGTLIQGMQIGKPCVTTAIGWFDELPDDTVIKIPYTSSADDLVKQMESWNSKMLYTLGRNAKQYIEKEFAQAKIAAEIYDHLSKSIGLS